MDNTLLIGLSQQVATYSSMETIANNLANISTPGYKRDSSIFEEYVSKANAAEGDTGPHGISLVWNAGTAHDFSAGRIDPTGAPYDFAINGPGYFVVQTPNGPCYTRDGHFTLNNEGTLVTEDGYPVQGDGGNITVTQDDGNVYFGADGTITGAKGQLGKLQMVQFDDQNQLTKQGGTLYAAAPNQTPQPATKAKLKQGALESSNVEPVIEMTHMIDVMRAYQTMANLSQSRQDQQRQTIDKLAAA